MRVHIALACYDGGQVSYGVFSNHEMAREALDHWLTNGKHPGTILRSDVFSYLIDQYYTENMSPLALALKDEA